MNFVTPVLVLAQRRRIRMLFAKSASHGNPEASHRISAERRVCASSAMWDFAKIWESHCLNRIKCKPTIVTIIDGGSNNHRKVETILLVVVAAEEEEQQHLHHQEAASTTILITLDVVGEVVEMVDVVGEEEEAMPLDSFQIATTMLVLVLSAFVATNLAITPTIVRQHNKYDTVDTLC